MAETFLDQIEKGQDKKMVFISSVVGSIADDHQKAFAYATSKTALNKSVALMADILKEREVKVLAMCPGYVKRIGLRVILLKNKYKALKELSKMKIF